MDKPQFSPTFIPIFFVMDSSNKKKNDAQKHGFVRLNNFVKSATLNGIALHHMTRENMLCLANESKGSTKKELLCGYLFSSHLKVDCDLPTSKKMKEEYVKTWREVEGHDCVELKPKNGKYIKQIICWDPAAVYSIYLVGPLDADDMKEFAENIGAVTGTGMVLHPVSHTQSPAESRILGEIPVGDSINCLPFNIEGVFSQQDSNTKNQGLAATTVSSLQGTWAEYIQFSKFLPMNDDKNELPLRLHSYSSQTDHGVISLSTERDLIKKLSLVNGNNEFPFAGIKALERGIREQQKKWEKSNQKKGSFVTLYQLLLALEIHQRDDQERAISELETYCSSLQEPSSSPTGATIAHPLLLLAFGRIGFPGMSGLKGDATKPSPDKTVFLRDFGRCAPGMLQLLDDEENRKIGLLTGELQGVSLTVDGRNRIASPNDMWEELKDTSYVKSDAMEELLKMTGLLRVKKTAVELFKQGLTLSRMDDKTRKLNTPSLNYVFLGNPGTGKTTVRSIPTVIFCY